MYPTLATADPYIAAEDFLSTNSLSATYLDQVAEFIIQNTGNSSGSLSSMAADPFTGTFSNNYENINLKYAYLFRWLQVCA